MHLARQQRAAVAERAQLVGADLHVAVADAGVAVGPGLDRLLDRRVVVGLDEVRAALGLVQLRRLSGNNDARARVAAEYRARLDGTHGMVMPFRDVDERTHSAHHLAVLLLPDDSRDTVREVLAARRIQTSIHYPPIHTFSRYRTDNRRSLPHTEDAGRRLVTLPLYPHLTTGQCELVMDTLCEATR